VPIRSIEIICPVCPKCENLENRIREIIKNIEAMNKIKIPYELRVTRNMQEISKYSLNPSQTPAILINGNVEFAGRFEFMLLKKKLEATQRS
jgi:hypothetical protein